MGHHVNRFNFHFVLSEWQRLSIIRCLLSRCCTQLRNLNWRRNVYFSASLPWVRRTDYHGV